MEKLDEKKLGADYFREAAEQGDAEAQYHLGKCYALGYGVEKDYFVAVEWYRKSAEQGDAEAQCHLGVCYAVGDGVEKDGFVAIEWFRKAAEQGNAGGLTGLGCCYLHGNGVSQDYAKAFELFCEAVELGNVKAQFNLGVMYANGLGVEKDEAQAVEWYRKSAEQGDTAAQRNLGVMYANGRGVEKDEAQAVAWYRKAAEQGDAAAQNNLGVMYDSGCGVEKDEAQAVEWYRKAAEQGNVEAQFNLGGMYACGLGVERDEVEAAKWYRKAAEQGFVEAQFKIGVCYQYGHGVEKNEAEAVMWYRKAAEQGNIDAQKSVGACYRCGIGVKKDVVEAVSWYCKAADQGDVDAQERIVGCYRTLGWSFEKSKDLMEAIKWYRKAVEIGGTRERSYLYECYYKLGNSYEKGDGVKKSLKEAVLWYRKAADLGYTRAQRRLGVCYEYGRGVERNLVEAGKWYRKAADQGDAYAMRAKVYLDNPSSEPAQLLREGKIDRIFWPEVAESNVAYVLSPSVPKVLAKFGYHMDYQTGNIRGNFPDVDCNEWFRGLLEKIYYEFYNTKRFDSDVELVFARERTEEGDVRFYAWDEREYGFVKLLKEYPSICLATFNERFAKDFLHVQRQLNRKAGPAYFFNQDFTRLIGMNMLERLIIAAKRGNVNDFLEKYIIPAVKKSCWGEYCNEIILRAPYLTAYGETGCNCWNFESSDFSSRTVSTDSTVLIWAGGERLQEKGLYCVFIPESIAFVIMRAISAKMKEDDGMIAKVLYALGEVYRNDYFLIENKCHELSIVGAFYRYFRNEYDDYFKSNFPGVSIDMEYSKMGEELCAKPAPPNEIGKKHMRIDFVVHERKCQKQNLLAIEFKLEGRMKELNWDYEKLKAITVKADNDKQVRNYGLGISIELKKVGLVMKLFKDGNECGKLREYIWNEEDWKEKNV